MNTCIDTWATIGDEGSWDLVRAAQGGDRAAFAELYRRYRPGIERYVGYRVRQDWVEDVVSETFLRALRRIGSVSYQGRDVGAWLVTIARNVVLDRAKSSRVRLADHFHFGEVPDRATPEAGPEELVVAASERAAAKARLGELIAAATALSPIQRRCLRLRFGEELPFAAIGARLGCTERAAKAVHQRGLAKLRLAAGVRPASAPSSGLVCCAGQGVAA